jgi:hypothetical protein
MSGFFFACYLISTKRLLCQGKNHEELDLPGNGFMEREVRSQETEDRMQKKLVAHELGY